MCRGLRFGFYIYLAVKLPIHLSSYLLLFPGCSMTVVAYVQRVLMFLHFSPDVQFARVS